MLAEDVSRRAHLEVVDVVVVGNQIRVPVLDNVAGIAAEEQRFGWTSGCAAAGSEFNCWRRVFPQREHALLRIVPAEFLLVERDVCLNRGGLVNAQGANRVAVIIDSGIGERCARRCAELLSSVASSNLSRQSVDE